MLMFEEFVRQVPCRQFDCHKRQCALMRVFPHDCKRGCSAYDPAIDTVSCQSWKIHMTEEARPA